jgi:hypothetical protein
VILIHKVPLLLLGINNQQIRIKKMKYFIQKGLLNFKMLDFKLHNSVFQELSKDFNNKKSFKNKF